MTWDEATLLESGVHHAFGNGMRCAVLRTTSRGDIIGSSQTLKKVLDVVDRIAPSDLNVLITGESGVGKELVVAALHDASARADEPLVAVNCGALPECLIESELFGHKRGAFTGAVAARPGYVAQAEGGTLFLDEVGELPLALQAKLLRLIQQREYTPLGQAHAVRCNVRIVAATNRDLREEVAAGRFREDLYYRLSVIPVTVPALRERREDVESLANFFLAQSASDAGREDLVGFDAGAIEALASYDWPGNIRELRNIVQRAALLSMGPIIGRSDLARRVEEGGDAAPDSASVVHALPEAGLELRDVVDSYETNLIVQALQRTSGNKNQAAKLLGLNRTTLVEMVKRKGLASQKRKTG